LANQKIGAPSSRWSRLYSRIGTDFHVQTGNSRALFCQISCPILYSNFRIVWKIRQLIVTFRKKNMTNKWKCDQKLILAMFLAPAKGFRIFVNEISDKIWISEIFVAKINSDLTSWSVNDRLSWPPKIQNVDKNEECSQN